MIVEVQLEPAEKKIMPIDKPDAGAADVRPRFSGSKETIIVKWLFRISVSIGLAGMVFGMAMGMTQNFLLAPAHAHFLLLGYVAMFLSALYYRTVPEAAASRLAPLQAVFSVFGAILFPIGIACVRLGDRHRFMPALVGGWLTVLTGMLLFAVIVYRSSGRAAAGATTEVLRDPAGAVRGVIEGEGPAARSASQSLTD